MTDAAQADCAYRLDELGWLQFERVCQPLLEAEFGLRDLTWTGRADDARIASTAASVVRGGRELPGPVTLAIIWVRENRLRNVGAAVLADCVGQLAAERLGPGEQLVVLTNLAGAGSEGDAAGRVPVGAAARRQLARAALVLGPAEIGRSLDRHPRLRAAVPAVLGLRDLTPLIDPQVRARSTFDFDGAVGLARVFAPTRAFDRARRVLDRHGFVVLSGPPEMGKTAIAQMIGLAQLAAGTPGTGAAGGPCWEVHECTRPEQVWRAYAEDRRQVFIADDAFGQTEYSPDAAERWAAELARLLAALDDRHWLIWTSRPAPLKAGLRRVQRERGSERFPAPGEVIVDAGELDLAEKTLILFRHAKARRAGRKARGVVQRAGITIVEHPHFTPERIRRFVTHRLDTVAATGSAAGVIAAVERELGTPTAAMVASWRALEPEHRDVLIGLLDAPAGLVDDRALAAAARRHHTGGLTLQPSALIDRLTDHFLKVTPLGIGWVHPSWRDLAIDELHGDADRRRRFLEVTGVHGALLVLSTGGGATGERGLPLLVDDADWDLLGDRAGALLREVEDRDAALVLRALGDALRAKLDVAGQRRELEGLAVYLLGTARRTWDACRRPLPVFLLERWYEVNAELPEPVTPPQLGPTWTELHPPTAGPIDPGDGDGDGDSDGDGDLDRADDWLALAGLLAEHDPGANTHFGFPISEQQTLARLIDAAGPRAAAGDETAASVLRRIRRLVRSDALDARLRASDLVAAEQPDWWIPTDLDAPPTDEPAEAPAEQFRREDVARVLRDL